MTDQEPEHEETKAMDIKSLGTGTKVGGRH